jgi:membrane-bound lytic murein transglycosylase D
VPLLTNSTGFSWCRAILPALLAVSCSRGPQATSAVSPNGVTHDGRSETDELPAVSPVDLHKRTAALFGDALRLDASIGVPVDSAATGAEGDPTWDIDVRSYETVERVRHYVAHFSGAARDRFADRLSRGTRYEAMIRAKLRAGDLPEDMYYLALVESGFNPHAYSRAAAVGMWQFMTATGRGLGLRIDWWVDERRDPVRSTVAAVRFLRGLREQFGSLYLAAAAYNGGPGRVARGLTRYADELEGTSGDDMFFALAEKKYLRNETKEYVPQLIAAALVAKEPDRYGIRLEREEPFAYDSVVVGPRFPLSAVAEASGTSVGVIQELNPHILRGMTPPRDSMKVRIPLRSRMRFDSVVALLPNASTTGAKVVTAEKGATWASLARQGGISARALALYNPKVKPAPKTGRISAGTKVLVPTPAVVSAALSVPDPDIERYGRTSGTRTHVVRRGENLSTIAKRYGTSSVAIMRLNRLQKPLIFPGQELLVTGRAVSKTRLPISKATARKR